MQHLYTALGGTGLLLALSACTAGGNQPDPVDPETADVAGWSKSVLGEHTGTSLAGRHEGDSETSGTFDNVQAGWYRVAMACAGGGSMTLSITADGDPVGNGTTGCNTPAANTHIQVMADAGKLEFVVSNAGEQILWAVGLEETPEPTP